MASTLLIGYDVERIPGRVPGEKWVGMKVREDSISVFLKRIVAVHREFNVPATLFMVGQCIESHLRELERCLASGLFELAQHTQAHYPLKTILEETGSRVYLRGLNFGDMEEQIARPVELLKKYFGVRCMGLTAPYTYYRGLSDRPDILEIISRHGMVYTRSYGRNSHDYFPLDWDVQPFWYDRQGFPDLLEIPVQGWIDAQWRHDHGWEKLADYHHYLKERVDEVKTKDTCWSHVQHDWTSTLFDENLEWTKKFITYAAERMETKTHGDYYKNRKEEAMG